MILLECENCHTFVNMVSTVRKCHCGEVVCKLISQSEGEFTGTAIIYTIQKRAIAKLKKRINQSGSPMPVQMLMHHRWHPRIHNVNELTWED